MAADNITKAFGMLERREQEIRDLRAKLAKFEQAKMPEEPKHYQSDRDGTMCEVSTGIELMTDDALDGFIKVRDYEKIRTYAAAEHVRAEEAEAKTVGKILRGLRSENDSTQLRAIIASIEASFPDAIRALQKE